MVDWTDRRTLVGLPPVDQLLVAVSYDRGGPRSHYDSQVGGLRNLLQVIAPQTHICYISTTGVYHQSDGSWVDETSPTRPNREAARVHLEAEELLRRCHGGSPWTILRLAGIYGPGRVPRMAKVRCGRPITATQRGYLNLIHVDDAAEAVMRTWSGAKRRLYVVGDDHPVVRRDFYREIARRCDAPPPSFIEPTANGSGTVRSESNKRVWNRRMKRDLVEKLKYPSFREGLASIL